LGILKYYEYLEPLYVVMTTGSNLSPSITNEVFQP